MNAGDRVSMNRRRFLQTGAAATLSLAGLPAVVQAVPKEAASIGGFTLGVQSYTFRKFKLEQVLKQTQELGLHFIEFYRGHVPVTDKEEQIVSVRKLCKEYGITMERVIEKNISMREGSVTLWEWAKALLKDAVGKGFLERK